MGCYGGLWGAINTNKCMEQRVHTSACPTARSGILMIIAPHSPPYTTKRLYKLVRACLDVVGCVWVLVVAYGELYMSRSDHIWWPHRGDFGHMRWSYMTIYVHLELNTDHHNRPNTSYNTYWGCTKLMQVFGGVWVAMGTTNTKLSGYGRRWRSDDELNIWPYIDVYSPP